MNTFAFFDNNNIATLIVNIKKEILYTNYAFKKTFGKIKNIDNFSKRFFISACMLNPENIQKNNPIDFALLSKETLFVKTTYQTPNGNILYFDINSFPSEDFVIITFNNITLNTEFAILSNDFSAMKKNFSNLQKENKKFSEIQQKAQSQAIKMAILNRFTNTIRESVNVDKIIQSALHELSTFLGGFKSYFCKSNDFDSYEITNIYPSKYNSQLHSTISFDKSVNKEIIARNYHISKCLKEYQNAKEPFKNTISRIIIPIFHQSQLLGILVIFSNQDISLTAEQDILKPISIQLANTIIQAYLFKEINEKNIQLENTLNELKKTQLQLIQSEKMASLGQLIAGVAHEINTPLASINSNNDLISKLIDNIKKNTNEIDNLDMLTDINNIDKEAIKRIKNIVISLKQYVRLDEAELQLANINDELDLTLNLIKHETKNRIKIIKNYSQLPSIKCYPNMLNQVFMNLLINAIQSIKENGEIKITTKMEKNFLTVSIEDNGCGIKSTIKDKIFQAGFTSKKVGLSTGLGLAISKKIIEKHNGKISFLSNENKGTTFNIEIPISQS